MTANLSFDTVQEIYVSDWWSFSIFFFFFNILFWIITMHVDQVHLQVKDDFQKKRNKVNEKKKKMKFKCGHKRPQVSFRPHFHQEIHHIKIQLRQDEIHHKSKKKEALIYRILDHSTPLNCFCHFLRHTVVQDYRPWPTEQCLSVLHQKHQKSGTFCCRVKAFSWLAGYVQHSGATVRTKNWKNRSAF